MTTLVTMILAAAVWSSSQSPDDELRARAERLHREAIVLDTHADLTPFLEKDTKPIEITAFPDQVGRALSLPEKRMPGGAA